MSKIKILCSTHSHEAIALAVRLSGELIEHQEICDRGHIMLFSFSKESYMEQFAKAVTLYPEFIEVPRDESFKI